MIRVLHACDMFLPAKEEGQEQRRSDTTRPARAHNAHFGILMGLGASYPVTGFHVPTDLESRNQRIEWYVHARER
jgi:hypothetical protein